MNSEKKYKDFYDLFGLPTNATEDEIKNRTKSMIKKFHPDLADDEIAASAKQFKTMNFARKTLKNSDLRNEYDELGHHKYVKEHDNKIDGFNFQGRHSITDSDKKSISFEDDVDELIENNLSNIHDAKNKKMQNDNRKQNKNTKEELQHENENPTGVLGLVISFGMFLKSTTFKYIIMSVIFVLLYAFTYTTLGLIATIFVVVFSIMILLAIFNLT